MLKRTEPRAFSWVAPAIAIAGAALLIYWTGRARPLWLDEEMLGLNVRSRGFADLAGALWLDQSAPLGWLALERLIMLVFGTGERSVRLLTTVFGSGTLAVAVWIGRRSPRIRPHRDSHAQPSASAPTLSCSECSMPLSCAQSIFREQIDSLRSSIRTGSYSVVS